MNDRINKKIRWSAVAGLCSLIIACMYLFVGHVSSLQWLNVYVWQSNLLMVFNITALTLYTIAFAIFAYGFVLLGGKYQKQILKIAAYAFIAFGLWVNISTLVEVVGSAWFSTTLNILFYTNLLILSFFYLAAGCVVGVAAFTLRSRFGSVAIWYGIIGIVWGIYVLLSMVNLTPDGPTTLILFGPLSAWLEVLLLIPGTMLLFRAAQD